MKLDLSMLILILFEYEHISEQRFKGFVYIKQNLHRISQGEIRCSHGEI